MEKISPPIIFFEEYPHKKENQIKAELLDFPCIVFLAANNIKEFYAYKREYLKINPNIELAWWPVFKTVWLSPFTSPQEIENLIFQLKKEKSREEKLKILLDLELPFLRAQYFLIGLKHFKKSKQLIEKLIEKSKKLNVEIYTFEYPPNFLIFPFLLEKLGLTFLKINVGYKRILSCYTSSTPIVLRAMMKKTVLKEAKKDTREIFIALGLFARGRVRWEKLIKPAGLKKDLNYFLSKNVNKFAFFRLGGLNQEFLKIIHLYL